MGLAPALEYLAREFGEDAGTPVRFRAAGAVDALPDMVGTVLFRIAQEALTNVERHAQASTIELSLERVANRVSLSIADDGVGFDTDDVAVHPKRGIGLRNMMERMEAIGGRLSVNSTSSGTSVVASIDLKE